MHITGYDHVGIRVTDRARALSFYEAIGFRVDPTCSNERVAEIVNEAGVRINLIFNGVPRPSGANVLLDEPDKWPGVTHAAFVVDTLDRAMERFARIRCPITEGPVDWGRRLTCFIRDPDGNVLEFNEIVPSEGADR
ncbi:MAG TPA: VOC family protein [Allosphingosinicella sp.]|nr:VOC family protein [Allosphingosinicella sp.]